MNRMIALLLACSLAAGGKTLAQPLRAGVVEFEEKNDIGLQNARTIVPENLVGYLKQLGKYQLAERLYLKQALAEQKLQMTGAVDDNTAVQFGKMVGLQAVITGSCMKVGPDITISGRAVNVETGMIIAAGTVTFSALSDLNRNMEELAYLLSGYSQDSYRAIKARELIGKSRYELQLGAGYALNSLDLLDRKSVV